VAQPALSPAARPRPAARPGAAGDTAAIGVCALFVLMLFSLWWHRPSLVPPAAVGTILVVHTAVTLLLLRCAYRLRAPALPPLIITVQLLTMVGFVLRIRLGAAGPSAAAGYLLGVLGGIVLFVGGRRLATTRGMPGPEAEHRRNRAGVALFGLTVLCCLILPAMHDTRGAEVSLSVGPLNLQPAELLRVCLLGWMAFRTKDLPIWGRWIDHSARRELVRLVLLPALFATTLFAVASDLGPAVLLFIAIMGLVVYQSSRWVNALVPLALFGALAEILVHLFPDHFTVVSTRFTLWSHPFYGNTPAGHRTLQQPGKALLAYARGGLTGQGLGLGRVSSVGFEIRNDYIAAALGEDLGLIGLLLVVALYALLLRQLYQLADGGPERWLRGWSIGLTVMLTANIAWPLLATTGVLPIIGITTPLLSAGGTSTLVVLAVIGLVAGAGHGAGDPEAAGQPRQPRQPGQPGGPARSGRATMSGGRLAPALGLLLIVAIVAATTYRQELDAPRVLHRYDPTGRIARTERAAFDRGAVLSADGQVLASSDFSGPHPARHVRPDAAALVGRFRAGDNQQGTLVEDRYAGLLECGTAATRARRAVLGQRCQRADLVLALDAHVQRAALDALRAAGAGRPGIEGAVVALDPRTGGILALASVPAPGPASGGGDVALSALHAPGPVFDIVTASAALMARPAGPDPFPPRARLDGGPGAGLANAGGATCTAVTLPEALRDECNTAFGQLGQELGVDTFGAAAAAFGFDTGLSRPCGPPELSFGTEGNGFCDVDGLAVAPSRYDCGGPARVLGAVGGPCVAATPFQLAMVAAAVAGQGTLRAPRVAREARRGGDVVWSAPPSPSTPAMTPAAAGMIRTGMVAAVRSGAAAGAAVGCATVAAAVTAPTPGDPANPAGRAWSVAFAPADEPTIALAVYLGPAGTGAGGAPPARPSPDSTPVARAVMGAALGC